jgi:histidyl-tRNA synthetase
MSKKKNKTNKVRPQLLKGFRDYPPGEQIAREKMIGRVKEVFENMGFLPLQTASLELASTLLGPHYNKDSLAELFGFEGPDNVEMALRYEFTVSLARYVAADQNIPLPFRRYQYGNVWRVDKPGPGRYREFMQFDIDIVGTKNLLADSEIIAAMVTTFEQLGIRNFKVRFSNRKILNGLMEFAGIESEKSQDVMRVIDKLDKQGRAAVIEELGGGRIDRSGDKIQGLNLSSSQILELEKFLDIAQNSKEPIQDAENLLGNIAVSKEGIDELKNILSYLESMKVSADKYEIDMTIVRGLGYYTGPVFETTLLDLPEFGSVFSGGRYDNLVDRFSGKSLPAVGSSIGIDRLLAALIELKTFELESATSKVLVTVMDKERISDYLDILQNLRNQGISSEIFSGDTKNLTKQIKYGDKVGIPFAVIRGSDEFDNNMVTVKNLKAGKQKAMNTDNREEWLKAEDIQETISMDSLIEYLKQKIEE